MVFIPTKQPVKKRGKRRNKYGAKKCDFMGKKFDSIIERDRYIFLKEREREGAIHNLRCQVEFSIDINGEHICKYIADFVYDVDGMCFGRVEDVKGMVTGMFRLKAKLMKAVHGIEILIVKSPTSVIC